MHIGTQEAACSLAHSHANKDEPRQTKMQSIIWIMFYGECSNVLAVWLVAAAAAAVWSWRLELKASSSFVPFCGVPAGCVDLCTNICDTLCVRAETLWCNDADHVWLVWVFTSLAHVCMFACAHVYTFNPII